MKILTNLLAEAGLFYGAVMFVRVLNQSLRADTRLYEPAAYQAEKLKAHPTRPGEFGPRLDAPDAVTLHAR